MSRSGGRWCYPSREHIEEVLDAQLTYNPTNLSKNDGKLNSSIGNLMADITYEQSNPIFNKRTGNNIDFVLLNHGGIRAAMSKGKVSRRTAYEIMPFKNETYVLELSAKKVKKIYLELIIKLMARLICLQKKCFQDIL